MATGIYQHGCWIIRWDLHYCFMHCPKCDGKVLSRNSCGCIININNKIYWTYKDIHIFWRCLRCQVFGWAPPPPDDKLRPCCTVMMLQGILWSTTSTWYCPLKLWKHFQTGTSSCKNMYAARDTQNAGFLVCTMDAFQEILCDHICRVPISFRIGKIGSYSVVCVFMSKRRNEDL